MIQVKMIWEKTNSYEGTVWSQFIEYEKFKLPYNCMNFKTTERLEFHELLKYFENHLKQQIMPFWLEHCVDHEREGFQQLCE